jgi:glucosyl-3-phosphoglycerate synthase
VGDFYQSNMISTFHWHGTRSLPELERELDRFARHQHLSLVLPALYAEFEGRALPQILSELEGASYVHEIVLVLGRADRKQFRAARETVRRLPEPANVLWIDSPRIQKVLRTMEENDLYIGEDGKGRSVWLTYGYLLGRGESQVIAVHDCDILSYERGLLARLVYPLMDLKLSFEFAKGYYARITDRMFGRVTRLFVSPLIRALTELIGHESFLAYLEEFRYPLSGEVALTTDLARLNRIPAGWGLEVGTLAEVYRNTSPKRVCQVDLAVKYEHKHQPLSPEDPEKGLLKMCIDISRSIFHTLASEGIVFGDGLFRSLQVAYRRTAQDTIVKYAGDAALNGLTFDRHAEGLAVETFLQGLRLGGEQFMTDPTGGAQIPNWNRVADALPDIQEQLVAAVTEDNAEE